VEQGRLDEARKVSEKVRGAENVDVEFKDLNDTHFFCLRQRWTCQHIKKVA